MPCNTSNEGSTSIHLKFGHPLIMVTRRNLKNIHEDAVLRHFKDHLRSNGTCLEILNKPDPPEAIVALNGNRTWIEITDAYLDKAHAISLTSAASDDIEHIPDGGRLILDPDETYSNTLHSVIASKYAKNSIRSIADSHGPGILLVGIFTPFTTAEEVAHDAAKTIASLLANQPSKIFQTIYTYDGTGRRRFHVLYRLET